MSNLSERLEWLFEAFFVSALNQRWSPTIGSKQEVGKWRP